VTDAVAERVRLEPILRGTTPYTALPSALEVPLVTRLDVVLAGAGWTSAEAVRRLVSTQAGEPYDATELHRDLAVSGAWASSMTSPLTSTVRASRSKPPTAVAPAGPGISPRRWPDHHASRGDRPQRLRQTLHPLRRAEQQRGSFRSSAAAGIGSLVYVEIRASSARL